MDSFSYNGTRICEVSEANLGNRSATRLPYSRCYLSPARAQRSEERNEVSTAEFPKAPKKFVRMILTSTSNAGSLFIIDNQA